MSFQLKTFSSLLSKYTTWVDLYRYLISPEGGSLRIIERGHYAIVRYVKGKSDMNKEHVRHFRSVVWNTRTNRPLCVAPVKAEKNGDAPPADMPCQISEFIDGSMINIFADATQPKGYRIASRSTLDANTPFYTNTTFAEMFDAAVQKDRLSINLEPTMFLCTIVQHPENRVVVPVKKPHIWITHVGTVDADGNVTVHSDPAHWPAALRPHAPAQLTLADTKVMKDTFEQKGFVIQSSNSSQRWRRVNDEYEAVRKLRGAEAGSLERFLRLRKEGFVKQYLDYYKEDNQTFWNHEKLLRERTQQLHDFYVRVKKLKSVEFKAIPVGFRPHVYALHGKYIASLPTAKSIDKPTVIAYVNELNTTDQANLLRTSLFVDDAV
jgi:hypothetical protein